MITMMCRRLYMLNYFVIFETRNFQFVCGKNPRKLDMHEKKKHEPTTTKCLTVITFKLIGYSALWLFWDYGMEPRGEVFVVFVFLLANVI